MSNKSGWCVTDANRDHEVVCGPYKYKETAGAVRKVLESTASEKQNERWNLHVTWGESDRNAGSL